MQLSKSDYMLFLKHPAWLWIKKHAKHLLPPVDPALQARFDEGHAFEPYVEALFPDIVKLGFSSFSEYRSLSSRTLETWRSGVSSVAQGRYEHGREATGVVEGERREPQRPDIFRVLGRGLCRLRGGVALQQA